MSDHAPAAATPHAGRPALQGPLRVEHLDLRLRGDRLRFYEAELRCRSGEQRFVPQFRRDALYWLDPAGNPTLAGAQTLALCVSRENAVVGRLLGVRRPGASEGYFTAFSCLDDPSAAEALFSRCARWLRELGCGRLLGPVGLGGDAAPGVQQAVASERSGPTRCDPPHLQRLIEASGLAPAAELAAWSWSLDIHDRNLQRLFERASRLEARGGVRVRSADLRHLERELPRWRLLSGSRDEAPYCVGGPEASACRLRELARAALPESVLVAEVGHRTVGVAVCVPDTDHLRTANGRISPLTLWRLIGARHKVERARLRLLATEREAEALGVETILLAETARRGLLRGWRQIELGEAPLDDHAMTSAARELGACLSRRAQLYSAPL